MTKTMKTLACAMALIGAVGLDAAAQTTAGLVASKGRATGTEVSPAVTAPEAAPAGGGEEAQPQLNVARLVIGTDVSEREPVGVASAFATSEVKRLLAFVEVQNPSGVESSVEIAWVDVGSGQERGHTTLAIGAQKRWRTWARHAAPKQSGEFAVVVRDASGVEIARTAYTMTE